MPMLARAWPRGTGRNRPLFIPLILGTNRKGRASELPARYVFNALKQRTNVLTEFVDLASFEIPNDDYGTTLKNRFPNFTEVVRAADGLLFVAPEYNHGYSGRLKTMLDTLYPEYARKAAAIAAVSSSLWGGVRMIEQLSLVLRELGLVVSRRDLHFPRASELFDARGLPIDPKYPERVKRFLDELIWLSKVLRWGRENV